MSRKFSGRKTKSGAPDRRTSAGKLFYKRSEAAKRGWKTRREREFEKEQEEEEIIIEEPIETVGGPRKKSGRRRK